MSALHIDDGSNALTVVFNDAKLVSDESVRDVSRELQVALIGASRFGLLVLDFEGVQLISLAMVRCLLSIIESARTVSVELRVKNIGYRITEDGTGLSGVASRLPVLPGNLTGRATPN